MNIGIWIDAKRAFIWRADEPGNIFELLSGVDDFHARGGYGSGVPFSPQDAVSDTKLERRRNQQFQKFFSAVMSNTEDAQKVYVVGPGHVRLGLEKYLLEQWNRDYAMVINTEAADSMTENQLKALFRNYFNSIATEN